MDNISNIRLTANYDSASKEITFAGFNESLKVRTMKIVKDSLTPQPVNPLNKHKYIEFRISQERYLVKIKDLAQILQVSSQEVIEANKEDSLKGLIGLTLEAKHYHVPVKVLKEAYEKGDIEKGRYLEYLADSYKLPLRELLEADEAGNLQEYLQETDKIESQCQAVFKKLDELNAGGKDFVTKDQNERFEYKLTDEELKSIKLTVRSALRSFAKNPTSKQIEQIVPITNKHSVMFKSSGDSVEILGLFGKSLGQGAAGVAVQRFNLLTGAFDTGEEAVLKIPSAADLDSEQIVQEVEILNKIHEKKVVIGIQKPLRLVKDVFNGVANHCHLGAMYQTDLQKVLSTNTFSIFEKKSIAYQLMRGLHHLHQINITHGDIKPGNIFLVVGQDPTKKKKETRAFLGDFGGAIEHQTDKAVPLQKQITPLFRFDTDDQAAKIAHKANDFKTYQEIEEKADVFAMCAVLCQIYTGQMPYNQPVAKTYQINNQLKQDLEKAEINPKIIDLLMKGLSTNYQERPSAEMLFNAVGYEFQREIKKLETAEKKSQNL